MKKYLFLFLIFLATPASAGFESVIQYYNAAGEAPTGCSCTGDVLFCWEMTADFVDTDNISGSGGCSVGDSTITFTSDAAGEPCPTGRDDYCVHIPTSYDSVDFDISSEDIIHLDEGTITFDLYVDTWAPGTRIFSVLGAEGTDEIVFHLDGTEDVRFTYEGDDTRSSALVGSAALSVDTWYSVILKWTNADVDPNVYAEVNGASFYSNINLAAWNVANPPTILRITSRGYAGVYYVKNFKIYSTWQE
jgi:hypothetical protein